MHEFPYIPEGACLGEFCPKQTNSIRETEGVEAIRTTVLKCEDVAGCLLNTATVVEVQNA